jgi:hypothetical protein
MIFRVRSPTKRGITGGLRGDSDVPQPRELRTVSAASQALGAIAIGAIAMGALAIGALAIGRLAIGRARIRRLEIDELVVRYLRVTEQLETPLESERKN